MKDIILKTLEEIEEKEQVKILFAVEAGSRAYGLHSPTSDYDVRFVYIRPREAYLQLVPPRDVLVYPVSQALDLGGWDLQKFLRLMKSANRSVFEWCGSPVVYRSSPLLEECRALAAQYVSPGRLLHQYLSAAEADVGRLVKKAAEKQYLAILRSVLSFRWIRERGTVPPVDFDTLAESCLEPEMVPDVDVLVKVKRKLVSADRLPSMERFRQYAEEAISRMKQEASAVPCRENPDWAPLDAFFLKALEEMN